MKTDFIRITDIQRYSVHDGPGIRTVVFFKGCPLRCPWCQNPETQSSENELAVFADRCIGCGACLDACPQNAIMAAADGAPQTDKGLCAACGICAKVCYSHCRRLYGQTLPVAEAFHAAARDRVFFENSSGGVTLSGGEPLYQAEAAAKLLRLLKAGGISTAVETCGYGCREDFLRVLEYTDVVLFDLKMIDRDRHKALTGADNGPILDNLHSVAGTGADLVVRVPIIPGVNDDEDNLKRTAGQAMAAGAREAHLLGFHHAGRPKWQGLGKIYEYANLKSAGPESLGAARAIFESAGLRADIGGGGA